MECGMSDVATSVDVAIPALKCQVTVLISGLYFLLLVAFAYIAEKY